MIKLTNKAKEHFKNILSKNPNSLGIRLGVKKSGCSGNSYIMDFAFNQTEEDEIFSFENIKIFIDKKSISLLQGLEIDCVSEGIGQHIIFKNPNSTGECGCGESFSVD